MSEKIIRTSEAEYLRIDIVRDMLSEIERAHEFNSTGRNNECSVILMRLMKSNITKP